MTVWAHVLRPTYIYSMSKLSQTDDEFKEQPLTRISFATWLLPLPERPRIIMTIYKRKEQDVSNKGNINISLQAFWCVYGWVGVCVCVCVCVCAGVCVCEYV